MNNNIPNGNAPNSNFKPNLVKPSNNANQSPMQNPNPAPNMPNQVGQNPNGRPIPPQMPQNQPVNNQGIVPPPPLPPQKKKSGCLIPIIIAAVVFLIVIVLIVAIIAFVFLKKGGKSESSSSKAESSMSSESESESSAETSAAIEESYERPTEEPTEPTPEIDYKKLYAGVVGDIFNSGEAPGGVELYSIYDNQFAVYDVDGDGREELIINILSTYTSGMMMKIYDYNNNGDIVEQFTCFPYTKFYDNGVVWVGISHNQGLAGEFWPYTLYTYDAENDEYDDAGFVDAWSKEVFPTDFNDEPYPDYIDKSKSGYVYYLYEDMSDSVKPVDESVYLEWVNGIIGNAREIDIPYMNLTEENIKSLDPTFTDSSGRPPEGDRSLAPSDMEIGEYVGSGRTANKTAMYMGPDSAYDTIITVPADEYLSIYGYNKKWCYVSYNGSTYTYSGYVKVEDVESDLFGGAKGKIKIATEKDPLNIRASASSDSKKIGEIPKGEIVAYYGYTDGWYKVKYNGKEGYVSAEFVEVQ